MNVFISYSKNKDLANLMKTELENEKIQVWKDTNIEAGTDWRNEIDLRLIDCDAVIVLLDQNSVKSQYVTYEWAFATGKGKTIIPVLVEKCDRHKRIEALQYIDFRGSNRPWKELIDSIKRIVGKGNTILWVDDVPVNNIHERETLEQKGFRFDLALSTKEALEKLTSTNYLAIISNMKRVEGKKEGYVLLKEVRKTNKTIPFFFYTGSNMLEHKIEAQEKGAQGSTNLATELIDMITSHVQPK